MKKQRKFRKFYQFEFRYLKNKWTVVKLSSCVNRLLFAYFSYIFCILSHTRRCPLQNYLTDIFRLNKCSPKSEFSIHSMRREKLRNRKNVNCGKVWKVFCPPARNSFSTFYLYRHDQLSLMYERKHSQVNSSLQKKKNFKANN